MKNTKITITAFTYAELKQNGAQWLAANTRFNAYLRRTGWNVDDFTAKFAGKAHERGYDMMMRRTAGEFSPREWLNCII